MNFRTLATVAAIAALSGTAQAAVYGEVPVPSKISIVEDASGATSATYNGGAIDKVLFLSGASASAKTIGAFVLSDNCDSTNVSVFWDSATGGNYRAYACDMKAGNIINGGATGSLLVVKRDAGGSAQGVLPIATPTKIDFINLSNCVAVSGSPAASLNQPNYTCAPSGTGLSKFYPDAGFSDVEPAIIAQTLNGGPGALTVTGSLTSNAIFQQVIGVAVNKKLYRALQATQGLTQDDAEANRPSLPTSFITSAVTSKLNGGNSKKGWGLVVSESVDPDVHAKQINVCRRAIGSGTQAAAFIQFSGSCTSAPLAQTSNATALAVKGSGTSSNGTAYTSTGGVEGCLGSVDGLTDASLTNKDGYAIGHIGRDNDPLATGTDKNYRFVKLDGAQPEAHPDANSGKCDGTRNFPGCTDAAVGRYPYVFESTMQWNSATPGNADKLLALQNIQTKGFTAAQLKGNSAAVVAGVMALPTSYSGLYGALAAGSDNLTFGSRVTRGGNSCTPLYDAK